VAEAEVILALDIGTGGARVSAYDAAGHLLASGHADYPTFYDHPAWSEQNPEDWWSAALAALRQVREALGNTAIVRAIGLTGQSPTIAPFDAQLRPLRRALLYQDNRATEEAAEWSERLGGREAVHHRTGHDPAAFYIGPKMLWLRRHEPEIFARTAVWLQPRDFAVYHLTGQLATDWSHAGSTLLFDIHTRTWATDFFETMGLSPGMLPPALAPWAVVGEVVPSVAQQAGLPAHVPVVIGGADSQCCTVGAGVLESSTLSDMAGTSTCLNAPVAAPLQDLNIANYCHVVPDQWCTELGLNASGAAFEWLTGILTGSTDDAAFAACEVLASQSPPGARGLLFLPYVADGERFDPTLRGGFYGISLRHGQGDLARAALEGVAFAIRQHLETMAIAGAPVRAIHASGGGAQSALWNQIKADVAGLPVGAVASDATSLGVALVAGEATGVFSSLGEGVMRCVHIREMHEPDPATRTLYDGRYIRFLEVARATAETASDAHSTERG
jgi:sugar (pentulose or hexulose) kinase